MLTQVTNNYSALQMHLVSLMQNNSAPDDRKSEEKKEENGGGSSIVPRQFLELGSGAAQEQSNNSLSEERTLSAGSPQNNNNINKRRIGRDESPESETWLPNKTPKLNPTKPVDQSADATMRKARVSVRARSEAPMVITYIPIIH